MNKEPVPSDEEESISKLLDIDKFEISQLSLLINFRNLNVFINRISNIYALRLLGLMFNSFGSCELFFEDYSIKNTKFRPPALVNDLISFYTSKINKQVPLVRLTLSLPARCTGL